MIVEHFKGLGFKKLDTEEFHDMICDCNSFRPSPLEKLAVKLGGGTCFSLQGFEV